MNGETKTKEKVVLRGKVASIDSSGWIQSDINSKLFWDTIGIADCFPPRAMYHLNLFKIKINDVILESSKRWQGREGTGEMRLLYNCNDPKSTIGIKIVDGNATEKFGAKVGDEVIIIKTTWKEYNF